MAIEHAFNQDDLAPQMIPESDPDFKYGLINGDKHEDAPNAEYIEIKEDENAQKP